jgi:hypothetical protein
MPCVSDLASTAGAQHRIGTNLPQHELRMRRQHIGCKPRHHIIGLFAVDAAVEHRDVAAGKSRPQLDGEPAGIGCVR